MGGRTVVGLLGIFGVIGINGRHIDQVDGKGPRLGRLALGEALGAIGVTTEVVKLRHDCNLQKYPVQEINATWRKTRPMVPRRENQAQISVPRRANLK
jgi:hypothetical protein